MLKKFSCKKIIPSCNKLRPNFFYRFLYCLLKLRWRQRLIVPNNKLCIIVKSMDTPIFLKKIENKQAAYNKVTEERNLNSKNSYFTKNVRIT